ncbi:WD40 repeat-like protein [Rhizoclosmatium globosum]|uniref:WD40 repeat-like protein n=1 Tax=Rhizoclosmatium globosum TaxID=329046 RepID=A0A1Y2CDV9_9FUNG|nr:WD40 repeat-like protein [Rhizoclosmatium globosum]|eukprot:ORY45251.1 WD40 repeat-like protein [Rhizoclosmatium globosum]
MPTLSSPTPTKSGGAQGRRRSLFIPSKTSSPSFSLSTQYQQSISPFSSCPETKRILEYSVAFQPRSISKAPFKVLDAPELQDDFYLNLVDWSYSNVLGVGLGSCVYLWDAQNSRVTKLCDLKDPTQNTVTCVNWNPKGNLAAIGTNKGVVQIWDVRAEKKIRELRGHDSRVGAIAWSAQDLLTTGSRDRNIFFRDIRLPSTDSITDKLHSHRQEVCGLKWASAPSNDNLLASGGNDNKLLIWDRAMLSKPLHTLVEHTAAVKAIAWSPYKAGLLASGGGTADQKIRFWNTSASPREATGGGTADSLSNVNTNSQVCNIAWSRSEDEIVSTHGFSQNQVVVWKVSATGQDALAPQLHTLATLTGHTMRVLYLAVSPDNENIVTGAGDETLRFWSVFGKKKKSDISGSWMENGPLVR